MKRRIIAVIIMFCVSVLISLVFGYIINKDFEEIFFVSFIGLLVGIFITYKDEDKKGANKIN